MNLTNHWFALLVHEITVRETSTCKSLEGQIFSQKTAVKIESARGIKKKRVRPEASMHCKSIPPLLFRSNLRPAHLFPTISPHDKMAWCY